MRKYFLLSAVALLTATSANAATDYAEVTAKATIEVASTLECEDIDFGTIVVKQNNEASTIQLIDAEPIITGNGVISTTAGRAAICELFRDASSNLPDSVTLTNENGKTIIVDNLINFDDTGLMATLNIPDKVSTGTYTGTFTLAYTY